MGPTNALQFPGITLDMALMEAHLPEDNLAECRTQLADFCSRKNVGERAAIFNRASQFCLLCCGSWSCFSMPFDRLDKR